MMQRIKKFFAEIFGNRETPKSEPSKIRIFEAEPGRWKFQTIDGAITFGNFDSYQRARYFAREYNFWEVIGDDGTESNR